MAIFARENQSVSLYSEALKNKYMNNISFYLDKRRKKDDGVYPIRVYLCHHKAIFVSTGLSAHEDEWEGSYISAKARNARARNSMLRNILDRVETLVLSLSKDKKLPFMSDKELAAVIREEISGEPAKKETFVDFIGRYAEKQKKENTKSVYLSTKEKVSQYDGNATFQTIDLNWLEGFDSWMEGNGLSVNSRSIHFRNIRTVFNEAIDNGETSFYPFRKFKIRKEETRKRSLSVDDLRLLRNYQGEDFIKEYQDMFMLMFYLIGVNSIDLYQAVPDSIVDGRFEYKRSKTGRLFSIKVEPEAMEIIERYKGKEHLLYVEDLKDYRTYTYAMCRGLKKLGEVEVKGRGGKKERKPLFPDISTYWARHTWATIAASLDIPKETISAALGHEIGSRVTSIYIDFDQKKVDEANRKVMDYVLYGNK